MVSTKMVRSMVLEFSPKSMVNSTRVNSKMDSNTARANKRSLQTNTLTKANGKMAKSMDMVWS